MIPVILNIIKIFLEDFYICEINKEIFQLNSANGAKWQGK